MNAFWRCRIKSSTLAFSLFFVGACCASSNAFGAEISEFIKTHAEQSNGVKVFLPTPTFDYQLPAGVEHIRADSGVHMVYRCRKDCRNIGIGLVRWITPSQPIECIGSIKFDKEILFHNNNLPIAQIYVSEDGLWLQIKESCYKSAKQLNSTLYKPFALYF